MHSRSRTLALVFAGLMANAFSAVGTALSWAAYASGDASGLQYMFLYMGAIVAVAAGAFILVFCLSRLLPWISLLAPALAVVLGIAPEITGIGYNGSVIDRPGQVAAVVLLVLHAAVAGYGAWWLWRARAAAARGPEAQPG
jgi:hypothetical protein